MDLHEDALHGAIGLFEASISVESSEWRAYVRALQLPERYVAFGALAVVERSQSAPLTGPHRLAYLEPESSGPDGPGTDYASESLLREALNAVDTQRALLTAPRSLSAPTQSPRFDRWLVLAVPAKDSTQSERAAGRRFWICAPLALDVLMHDATSDESRALHMQLFEGASVDPKQLIYSTPSSAGVSTKPELTTQLELGQRPFTVVWSKGPGFAEPDLTAPLYAATGSAFVTLLLAGLVMTLSSLSKRASSLAAARTLELADALRLQRAVLDGTTLSVIATDPAGVIREFNTGAEKMLGYRRAEMVGIQTPEIFHDPAEVIDRSIALSGELKRIIEPGFGVFVARAELGEMDEHEWTYVRNDGGRVPVLLSVTALRDVDGYITGYLGIARDLTETKRAARALSESEQRNRLFAEHAPAAVAMFDTEMRYLVISRQWIEDYQLTGREIIGASHYEVFPEVSAHWKSLHQRCLAGETLTHEADLFERANGERQWLSWRVQPWYSGPGRIGGIVMFTADITERVEANRALAASEQRVRLATEAAEVGVWEWDVAARRVLWDAQMFRMYGVAPTSDGSVPYELWCDAIHPEDRGEHQSTLRTALAHGSRSSREFRIRRDSDGMVRHLHSVETLSSDAGQGAPRIVGVSRDVTSVKLAEAALRESEERWKFALEGSGHGVWDWDLERGETFYSKQWRLLFGYDEHEVISETWQERIHPDDLASAVATLDRHRAQPESGHYEHEYRLRRKDGRYRWISARGKVVLANAEGQALRMLGTHTDVTQRKELEQTLADARDQAIEASRLKSEFLANMSHEIRTPMNGVIGMTELLLDTGLTPEQQEMGRIIRSSADSLLVIINDILDLSKVEAGKLNVSPEEFDPNALFNDALLPLAPAARDKGVALGIEFAGGPLPWLFGDPVRIRQVLTNLISNAIKFTQTGEVRVVVCALGETETDLGLQVEVRDTGIGIPREAQERLFQPFTQAEGGTTRRFGGTGLGLAISRRLVELMGGSVGFESELGRGSRFWFQLQLAKFDQRQAPSLPPLPLPLRALAVGPSAINRELIASQLRAWGVRVDPVETGTLALQRSHDQLQAGAPYDLALLDGALPDIEVEELALRIHAQPFPSNIPLVLVLSGRVQPDDSRLKSDVFSAVLLEPVRKRAFHSTLLRVLREAKLAGPAVAESGHLPLPAARVLRVLIAEDNRTNQIVVSRLLGKLGHQSEIAADGKEALVLLAQSRYDVVLMDCQMPEVDGYMATQKIRAGEVPGIDPHVPIIALTAHAMPADREKCLSVGMNDYVSKPLGLQDLSAALDRLGLGQARKYDVAAG
jgi:PAS domain S-box-containing protein